MAYPSAALILRILKIYFSVPMAIGILIFGFGFAVGLTFGFTPLRSIRGEKYIEYQRDLSRSTGAASRKPLVVMRGQLSYIEQKYYFNYLS